MGGHMREGDGVQRINHVVQQQELQARLQDWRPHPTSTTDANAADMYRLIKTYCEHTHVSYKELINEYGAQEEH